MQPLLRILMAVLVLVFAVGTFVHATAATNMKGGAPMAMAMGEQMPGCGDCGDSPDRAMAACVAACMLAALGPLTPTLFVVPDIQAPPAPALLPAIEGRSHAPEPYPPKPLS